jgi:malonate transporter
MELVVPETLNIVVSIFGLIGLGYVAARTRLLSAEVGERLADFVFTLAIPLLIFDTLARADLHGVSPWRIWAAYFVPFAVVWALSHLMVVRLFGRDNRAGIVAGGSAAYGNTVLIGIPLVQTAYGESGVVILLVVVLVHLPVLMVISLVLNERALAAEGAADRPARGEAWRRLGLSLATHPILVAMALGILWRFTGLAIPRVAAAIIEPLARSAGPLALFASGMALVSYGMARQIRPAFAISALKLLLMPALVLAAALGLGLSPLGIAAITLAAACPTGVNAPLIALRLGTGQALSSNVLLFSTAGGVITVTLWLVALREFMN